MQQGKTEPNFSHLVQVECIIETKRQNRDEAAYPAGNTLQKNLPRCIPSEQRTPPGNRDEEQQTHRSFDLACRHDLPASTALTRNDIQLSPATTKRQNSTDAQVCVSRVRNSVIILYKIVQIYVYFKDCSL